MVGEHGDNRGAMPPGQRLDADLLELVREWIDEGASADCGEQANAEVFS